MASWDFGAYEICLHHLRGIFASVSPSNFFAATGFLRGKGSQGSNGRTGLQDLIRDLRQGPKDLRPDAPTSKNRIKEEPVEGKIVAIVQLEMYPGTTL